MTDRDAMKLALEALNQATGMCAERTSTRRDIDEAITALRQALEQPEQEPVAWSVLDRRSGKHWYTHESKYTSQYYANLYSHRESDGSPSMVVTPLYTAPPKREWQGLTDEEVIDAWATSKGDVLRRLEPFVRAIEAKLKEKNHD